MILTEEKAYLAGVLDSAYFGIVRKGSCYTASIRMRRKSRVELEDIQKKFGGNIGSGRDYYYLNWNGQACSKLIGEIWPYLRTRVTHASLIMDLNYRVKNRDKFGYKAGTGLPGEERAYREELKRQIDWLNGKKQ